jgi:hypothetical protein
MILIGALLGAAVLLSLLDMVFGMYPFQHVWLNFYRNIFDGVAATYGVEPPTYYLTQIWARTGLAGVIMLAILLVTIRHHWRLSVPAILLIVAFSFIAHKEYRFYYPATLLLTLAAGWGLAELWRQAQHRFAMKPAQLVLAMVWSSALLGLAVWPFYNSLQQERTENVVLASIAASIEPDICGLAYGGHDFWLSGGYTAFHRDMPFAQAGPEELVAGSEASRFNYVLDVPELAGALGPLYTVKDCWAEGVSPPMCLYVRPGRCW